MSNRKLTNKYLGEMFNVHPRQISKARRDNRLLMNPVTNRMERMPDAVLPRRQQLRESVKKQLKRPSAMDMLNTYAMMGAIAQMNREEAEKKQGTLKFRHKDD